MRPQSAEFASHGATPRAEFLVGEKRTSPEKMDHFDGGKGSVRGDWTLIYPLVICYIAIENDHL